MKHKKFSFLIFILLISITGNLIAQKSDVIDSQLVNPENIIKQSKKDIQLGIKSINDYCTPEATCDFGDNIEDFIFAGIENTASGCSLGGYGDFTSMLGSAEIGVLYTAGFKTNFEGQRLSIWIDFNDDEIFSDLELILTDFELPVSGEIIETQILIPENANTGLHRLRAGARYYSPSSTDPCSMGTYGEWEDYSIEITGNPINYNACIISIDMLAVIPAGELVPFVTVGNFGIETASFLVTITEPAIGYSSTIEVVDLEYGQILQLAFDPGNFQAGEYAIEACTLLDGDEVPEDDCATHSFTCTDQPRQKVIAEIFTGTW